MGTTPAPKGQLQEEHYVVALKIISLALIIFVGILGNSVVIYTVLRERKLHRPPFYYLMSLSVADLARTVFCLPFVLSTVIHGSTWTHGHSVCTLLAFTNSFFVYSSMFALFTISVDRHLAVVYAKFHRKKSRGLVCLAVIIVMWGVSFVISFSPVVGLGTYTFKPLEAQCTFDHRYYRDNDTLGFIVVFALIMFAVVFIYTRIFLFMRTHRKLRPLVHQPARSSNWTFVGPGANGQAVINWLNGFMGGPPNPFVMALQNQPRTFGRVVNLRIIRNEHLTRLFFVVTVVFDLLWCPYLLLSFWQTFDWNRSPPPLFVILATWSSYLQVALNPIAYMCCKSSFRKAMRATVNAYHRPNSLTE
ncbi:probable G-protein coupled receptor 173 [Liolophura sinensis]|uniref:probable G-protein coupled receptor 173 n=1 Tax=Liolophura sinensis TaxID=3198878 RepID=UPI003158BB04